MRIKRILDKSAHSQRVEGFVVDGTFKGEKKKEAVLLQYLQIQVIEFRMC